MRAIEVESVGKKYRIGTQYHLTLRESLVTALKPAAARTAATSGPSGDLSSPSTTARWSA